MKKLLGIVVLGLLWCNNGFTEEYLDAFTLDKKITNGELLAYMDENISQKALELGRKQNPSLAGDPNKILMSYR